MFERESRLRKRYGGSG